MSRLPAIPAVVTKDIPPLIARILTPLKERAERMGGDRPGIGKIAPLPVGASLDQVISKINEILERMQT